MKALKPKNALPVPDQQFFIDLFQEIFLQLSQFKSHYQNYQAINKKLDSILSYLCSDSLNSNEDALKDAIKEHLRGNRGPIEKYFEDRAPLFLNASKIDIAYERRDADSLSGAREQAREADLDSKVVLEKSGV